MSTAKHPTLPNFEALPELPRDTEGVVFAAPWEAKAFALVVHLHQRGNFGWSEWVQALSTEIAADRVRPVPTPYYLLWLSAAEQLVAQSGLIDATQLAAEREALHLAQQSHDDHGGLGHHH